MIDPALASRIEETKRACEKALAADLAPGAQFLTQFDGGNCLEFVRQSARQNTLAAELVRIFKKAMSQEGELAKPALLERTLLVLTAVESLAQVAALPVDDSVKHLICKEFASYATPPPGAEDRFLYSNYGFIAMCRIALLRRFPGGLLDWEQGGFPRSWFLRMSLGDAVRTLYRLRVRVGALKPFLVWHMGGSVRRNPFLTEKEVRKSFWRMAAAAERQPQIKALMAGSWLISKETCRVSPHLSILSKLFLEAGGFYADAGPASAGDGFLVGDEERARLYAEGKYKPTFGIAMCTRQQALSWLERNREIAATLAVK